MMSNSRKMIEAQGVYKHFSVRHGFRFKKKEVLSDISFEVKKGEFLGIIGRNGSGKSTLTRIMMKAIHPTKGTIQSYGTAIKLIPGMGFNPNLTAIENIRLNSVITGKTLKEANLLIDEMLDFAELNEVRNDKIKSFSSGMRARLAFSTAIHVNPDILIMDEFFGGGGDIGFKEKAELAFKEFLVKNRTIVHVTHNLGTVSQYCDQVLVLNKGKKVFLGDPDEALDMYKSIDN